MRSKKVKRDKNYVSKVNKEESKVKTKTPNVKTKNEPNVKNKVKENEAKVTPSVKNKVKENEPKVKENEAKVTPSIKNKVKENEPKVKNKVKENEAKVKENEPNVKNKVKENEAKVTPNVKNKDKEVKKSPDLLNKHGYNITNRSVDRQQSLGKLVILYGVSDLIKKIDSISVQNPNLMNKYNDDKRWIKNNFKSKRSIKKS